jgi:glyoxylase-like metal-dependent hydrolase (beta-lactamase superfamily II)
MASQKLDEGLYLIDLHFQGLPGVIASYLLEDAGERVLIETGPESTLDSLLGALRSLDVEPESISKLLVTHIHLDHAGASGTFIRRFPNAHLYVHERGAPHMIDPSKLLASAMRIYGDRMGPLWGDFEPVPAEKLTALTDGDQIELGNRRLTALYTPGHAYHHVAFHDGERDLVFTGDVGAVRIQGMEYVRPPTPPPDLDLDAWDTSLRRIRELHPRTIALTHFGPFDDVDRHLQQAHDRLYAWAEIVERAVLSGQDRVAIVDTLIERGDEEIARSTKSPDAIRQYEMATPYGMTVDGYLRYLKKRAQIPAS